MTTMVNIQTHLVWNMLWRHSSLKDPSSAGHLEGRTQGVDVLFIILLESLELEEDVNVEPARRETFSQPCPISAAECVVLFNPHMAVLDTLGRPGARCQQTSAEESSVPTPKQARLAFSLHRGLNGREQLKRP